MGGWPAGAAWLSTSATEHRVALAALLAGQAEKPVLDGLTAYKAMTTIAMAVESYKRGQVLYFDEKNWKVVDKPPAKA